MTISSSTASITHTGNGVTTVFNVPFRFYNSSELVVTRITIADNTELLISSGAYSVIGEGEDAGGTVTYAPSGIPLSALYRLRIDRFIAFTQDLSLNREGVFSPEAIEQQLDRQVMMAQELRRDVDLVTPVSGVDGLAIFVNGQAQAIPFVDADLQMATHLASDRPHWQFALRYQSKAQLLTVNLPNLTVGEKVYIDGVRYARLGIAPLSVEPWHAVSANNIYLEIDERDISPLMFGAVRDGVTDESAAWNTAWRFARRTGRKFVAGWGITMLTSTVDFYMTLGDSGDAFASTTADLTGCIIKTTGSIPGLRVFGSQWQRPIQIIGLTIDHTGNATATAGVECIGASGWVFHNPTIKKGGNLARTKGAGNNVGSEGYAAFRIRESEVTDPVFAGQPAGSGGYYNTIYEPHILNEANGQSEIGIHFKGQSNQVNVFGGELRNCAIAVLYSDSNAAGDFVNSVNFTGVSIEDCTVAEQVQSTLAATVPFGPVGVSHFGTRYELINVKLNFGNALSPAPLGHFYYFGCKHIGSFSTAEYQNLAVAHYPNNFDGGNSSGGFHQRGRFTATKPFAFRSSSGAEHSLEVWPNSSKGLAFRLIDDTFPIAGFLGLRSGGQQGLRLESAINNGLQIAGVQSLSSLALREGKNFGGSFTIPASASSVAIVFATAEPDANYNVFVTVSSSSGTPPIGAFVFTGVTSKTAAGFTANVGTATGVGDTVTFNYLIVS